MNIPQHVPRFEEPTLLVVAGSQVARLFVGEGETLEEIAYIENKDEEYVVHNERSGTGQTFGVDPTHENEKSVMQRDFDHKLKQSVTQTLERHDVKEIHLFCPAHAANEVKRALPQPATHMISKEINGNFVKSHPLELLEKIT